MLDFDKVEEEFKKLKTIINDTIAFLRTNVNGKFSATQQLTAMTLNGIKNFQYSRKTSLNKIARLVKGVRELDKFEKEIELLISRVSAEDNDIAFLSYGISHLTIGVEQVTSHLLNLEKRLLQDQQNINEASYLLDLNRYLKFLDLNDFFIKDAVINSAPCTMYQLKTATAPQKGAIVVPGFGEVRQNYQALALSIAKDGLRVVTMDLPSQGKDAKEDAVYSLGLASEWIAGIARYFRTSGIQKVGAVGHSFGAYSILFAAGGYSMYAERNIFIYYERYQDAASKMVSYFEGLQKVKSDHTFTEKELKTIEYNAVKFEAELKFNFDSLISTIEFSISRQQTTGQGRIDVIVALAPPASVRHATKPGEGITKMMGSPFVPKRVVKGFARLIDMWGESDRNVDPRAGQGFKKMKTEFMIRPSVVPKGPIRLGGIAIYDKKAFAQYILNVKDPNDYFSLIHYFSQPDKVLGRPPSPFLTEFVNSYYQRIPKLFIYGTKDHNMRGLSPAQIEPVYLMCGNAEEKKGTTEIKRYEGRGHGITKGRDDKNDMNTVMGASGDTTNDIISFLNHHL
ncbi:MAG: hypothetical protein EPN86_02220 [Nanoarchaeota archaeon]|nr:MAG: hypothetical protein EPN86_02220 [Nanoarchaeota archaeon]